MRGTVRGTVMNSFTALHQALLLIVDLFADGRGLAGLLAFGLCFVLVVLPLQSAAERRRREQ